LGDELSDRSGIERATPFRQSCDAARSIDQDAAWPKPSEQRETGDIDEAQRDANVDPVDRGFDGRELALRTIEQLRAVTPADPELGAFASPMDLDLAGETLCVYDGNPARADREMVDVGARPRHAAIVQEGNPAAGQQLVQPGRGSFLAFRTAPPGPFMYGCLAQPEQQAPDPRMALAQKPLTSRTPTLVLAACARPSGIWTHHL
jgi:hypothetical protein